MITADVFIIRFSSNQRVPHGYRVVWSYVTEHYHGERLDDTWESAMTVSRWDARRWCIEHAALSGVNDEN